MYKRYRHFIVFVLVLVYMSVFESPPHHSRTMDQDQTFPMESTDLRENALDDMLHRICLQTDDPDILERSLNVINYNDKLILLYMPWKALLVYRGELVSTLFLTYIGIAIVLLWVIYIHLPAPTLVPMSTISSIYKTSMHQLYPSGQKTRIS